MTLSDFQTAEDGCGVSWRFGQQLVRKNYASHIQAVVLNSASGVLVVEPTELPNNAVIYNANGAMRLRVNNPLRARGALCFSDCGYEGDELTLIIRIAGTEFACAIDELGQTRRIHEIR